MKKIRVTRSIIPNLLTLGNIFSGFTAIIFISNYDFTNATLYIFMAAIFDMLDGIVARLLNATSEIGAELDSLCDAVSFGVAPAFMIYKAFFFQYGNLGILLASLPALAGVLRLARFNVQLVTFEDKLFFKGMPIPAAALTIVSFVIFYLQKNILDKLTLEIIAFVIIVLVPLAMTSTFKFYNLPRPNKETLKQRPALFIFLIVAIILVIITKGYAIFPVMIFYLLASPAHEIICTLKKIREKNEKN
ncbi:MAG: CDP-diacylglycerol--serine O-phosphatidyltransferase [Ignavibacteria bacterium]|jgi:CDP-diacylglycerol--serine O-phosphatidyltransferase|nr:CDP-diacylglycerol--serine O-phosphatidyltransferase [Ignavibacteria bacterium]